MLVYLQQDASVSQGRICSGSCTCCHTEIEVAEQTFHLTQSQYTDTGPTLTQYLKAPGRLATEVPIFFYVTGMTRLGKRSTPKAGMESRRLADAFTTRPTRRWSGMQENGWQARIRCKPITQNPLRANKRRNGKLNMSQYESTPLWWHKPFCDLFQTTKGVHCVQTDLEITANRTKVDSHYLFHARIHKHTRARTHEPPPPPLLPSHSLSQLNHKSRL